MLRSVCNIKRMDKIKNEEIRRGTGCFKPASLTAMKLDSQTEKEKWKAQNKMGRRIQGQSRRKLEKNCVEQRA